MFWNTNIVASTSCENAELTSVSANKLHENNATSITFLKRKYIKSLKKIEKKHVLKEVIRLSSFPFTREHVYVP